MGIEIKDIYEIKYKTYAQFRGTLRNERKFKMHQIVFIGLGFGENIKLFASEIIGISIDKELSNPSYIYTVRLPENIENIYNQKEMSLSCDRIFENVEQAKQSVLKNFEVVLKLEKENIERYFERFKTTLEDEPK